MNPTEELAREYDREFRWPFLEFSARVVPLERLVDRWGDLSNVTIDRWAFYDQQLELRNEVPVTVDHADHRRIGRVSAVWQQPDWLCAKFRLSDSPWRDVLTPSLLRREAQFSARSAIDEQRPAGALPNSTRVVRAELEEVTITFTKKPKFRDAGVIGWSEVAPPRVETPRETLVRGGVTEDGALTRSGGNFGVILAIR